MGNTACGKLALLIWMNYNIDSTSDGSPDFFQQPVIRSLLRSSVDFFALKLAHMAENQQICHSV